MNAVAQEPVAPMYGLRNEDGHYTWGGQLLPSVTTIIKEIAGEHLLMWYGKMAATECAEMIARRDRDEITADECDHAILDWQTRMTAAVRYRDRKAAIGSLMHHAHYERALGRDIEGDLVGFLEYKAVDLKLAVLKEGESEEEFRSYVRSLALHAEPYALCAFRWMDDFLPEYEMVGLEAAVISETHGYAGTQDLVATFKKSIWEKYLQWLWEGDTVMLAGDLKSSNSLDVPKVRLQLEAYRNAEFIGLMELGQSHPIIHSAGSLAVHVRPQQKAAVHAWLPCEDTFESFLALRQVYGYLHEMPKPNAAKRARKPAANKEPKKCPF